MLGQFLRRHGVVEKEIPELAGLKAISGVNRIDTFFNLVEKEIPELAGLKALEEFEKGLMEYLVEKEIPELAGLKVREVLKPSQASCT